MKPGMLLPIFPTVAGISNINRSLTSEELNCIYSFKDKLRATAGNTLDIYILEQEPLADIKRFCEQALMDYIIAVYNPVNKDEMSMKILTSWLNFCQKGISHQKHIHSNCVLTGSFYVNADPTKDELGFTKMDTGENWQIQPKQLGGFNDPEFLLKVGTGDVVIFPSNLTHHVPPVETYGRISLAFNAFFDGTLGFTKGPLKGINFLKIEIPNQKQYKPK
jgi:hypothetical protein